MKGIGLYILALLAQGSVFILSGIGGAGEITSQFYVLNKLQIPLFSGLLTVGAFLLSTKTFIIFRLKSDLYDNQDYIDSVRGTSLKEETDHYKGLRQLSNLLSVSILCSLVGSLLNLTLGNTSIAVFHRLCLTWSITTISFLVLSWIIVWKNIGDWFNVIKPPAKKS